MYIDSLKVGEFVKPYCPVICHCCHKLFKWNICCSYYMSFGLLFGHVENVVSTPKHKVLIMKNVDFFIHFCSVFFHP